MSGVEDRESEIYWLDCEDGKMEGRDVLPYLGSIVDNKGKSV